jgi:hypothetical protein
MDVGWFPHQVTRLVFDTGQPYDQFRADASAPHGFLIFWRLVRSTDPDHRTGIRLRQP